MPRASYQYGTSPRKYETEYTRKKPTPTTKKTKKTTNLKVAEKEKAKKMVQKKAEENKNKFVQVLVVCAIFVMLLAVSYREISIMEMFNQKKSMETQLSVIEKENGQVEKNIKEEESKLDWNEIKRKATEELGMQTKVVTPIDLEKSDNVETNTKLIEEENVNFIEKIIEYFIKK